MAAMNYAVEYMRELAQTYPHVLYFGALWSSMKPDVSFVNSDTIELPSLSVNGRSDGDKETIGGFKRNFNNAWEVKKIKNHRTWNTLAHPRHIVETNHVASISNITRVFNEEKKFPELDAIMMNELFSLKNSLALVTALPAGTITVNNVLERFDTIMDKMDEERVPAAGRLLYVDTYTKTMIDNSIAIQRQTGQSNLSRGVSRIDEVEVISVPTAAMRSKYIIDPANGFEADVSSAKVKMLLVHTSAICPVINYEFAQLEAPSTLSQGKWVYYEESFEDVFIYNKKHQGVQFITETA